jgi:hypothetical protein
MDESNLKVVVKYTQKGNKTFKNYDAIVTEAFKEKYITIEIEGMAPLVLRWDSFMYVGEFFGHNVTCDYKVERDFTAKKISASSQPYISIERKKSGRPESKR